MDKLSASGIVLKSLFQFMASLERHLFQTLAAHLKAFPGFFLLIMLTSGNLERTWLRNRNYITFVSEWFFAGDGQSLSGCISTTTPIKVVSHSSGYSFFAFLLRASSLSVGFMILCVCGDIRKTHKEPLEVCGVFFPHAYATSALL